MEVSWRGCLPHEFRIDGNRILQPGVAMAKKRVKARSKAKATKSAAGGSRSGRVVLRAASKQPIAVRHLAAPPTFQKPKRIHPRRQLPFIREGVERQFHSTSTRAILSKPKTAAELAGGDLVVSLNTPLTEAGKNKTASN